MITISQRKRQQYLYLLTSAYILIVIFSFSCDVFTCFRILFRIHLLLLLLENMRSSFLRRFLSISLFSMTTLSNQTIASHQSGIGVYVFADTGCDKQLEPYNDIALNRDYAITTPFQSFAFDPALVPGMVIDMKIGDCTEMIKSFDSSTQGQFCWDLPVAAQCFRLNAPPGVIGVGIDVGAWWSVAGAGNVRRSLFYLQVRLFESTKNTERSPSSSCPVIRCTRNSFRMPSIGVTPCIVRLCLEIKVSWRILKVLRNSVAFSMSLHAWLVSTLGSSARSGHQLVSMQELLAACWHDSLLISLGTAPPTGGFGRSPSVIESLFV